MSPAHGHVPPLRGESTPNFAGRKPAWPTGARSGLLRYRTSARRFERGAFSIQSKFWLRENAGILQIRTESLPLAALAQRALRVLVEQHRASHGPLYWVEQGACQHATSLGSEKLDGKVQRALHRKVEEPSSTTA